MITKQQKQFIEDLDIISCNIAKSEGKDEWLALHDLHLLHCRRIFWEEKDCRYFILPCPSFETLIMEEKILDVVQQNPDLFGTNCTYDVLKGIHSVLAPEIEFDQYVNFISREKFAYLGEFDGDTFNKDKVLRLDFYRLMAQDDSEFIGGLFHAFRHFNLRDFATSTRHGETKLRWIDHFMGALARAFFCGKLEQDSRNNYISRIDFLGHTIKFVFYFNSEARVYFLNTAYVED